MTPNDLLKAIADVGFPVVVSVYLLMVFGNKLDKLTDAVNNLTKYIEELGKRE